MAKLYFQKIRNKEAFLAATINLMLWPSQKSQLNENMNILVPLLRSLKKQELENLVKPLVHGGLPLPEAVQLMREITSRMGNAPFREVFSHMEDFIINWMRKSPLPETVQLMNKIVSQMGNATRFRNLKGVLGKGLNEMIDAYALLGTDAANAIASQMLELCQKCKEQGIWALYRSQPGRQEGTSKYEHWLQAQAAANEKLSCAFKNYLLGNGSESNSMNLLKMAMIAVKPQTQWFGFSRTPVTFELSILFENASYLAEMRSSLAPNGTNAAENIAMICNLLDRPSIDEKTHKDEFINLLRENGNIMSIISKICSKPLNQYINVFMYLLKYHLYEPFNDFLVSSLRKAKDLGAITPQAAEL
ncbi:MAG: hypothetical protein LBF94_00925 [Puniceicoccales bacterium]|nr:hypothetical protein [Puniceicoccales bacterium]